MSALNSRDAGHSLDFRRHQDVMRFRITRCWSQTDRPFPFRRSEEGIVLLEGKGPECRDVRCIVRRRWELIKAKYPGPRISHHRSEH